MSERDEIEITPEVIEALEEAFRKWQGRNGGALDLGGTGDVHDLLLTLNAVLKVHATAEMFIKALLDLPWDKRADVFWRVRFNGIFCTDCGEGSVESPNKNCQCQNDE